MKQTLSILFSLLCLAVLASAQTPTQIVTVLKGLDPVELVNGHETPGQTTISVVRTRYRYLFASEANRKTFEQTPEQYQIQFGGGCGQMGSLSGAGNPDRFYVFNKRIYIFASESCRNSFKKAPEQHLEIADSVPTGTATEQKRGQQLVQLALKGFGGAAKVDAVKNYQTRFKLAYKQGDKISEYPQTLTIVFPGQYRTEYDWGSVQTGDVLTAGTALSLTTRAAAIDTWQREAPVREALERALYREPLAILKARREKGFVAVATGTGKVGETTVEWLTVGIKGATSTLGIDPKTGHVLQIAYRERKGAFGDAIKTFSDFRSVNGLMMPFGVSETFNGKPVNSPTTTVESIIINANLSAALFPQP